MRAIIKAECGVTDPAPQFLLFFWTPCCTWVESVPALVSRSLVYAAPVLCDFGIREYMGAVATEITGGTLLIAGRVGGCRILRCRCVAKSFAIETGSWCDLFRSHQVGSIDRESTNCECPLASRSASLTAEKVDILCIYIEGYTHLRASKEIALSWRCHTQHDMSGILRQHRLVAAS
jgi:hypothetical protein